MSVGRSDRRVPSATKPEATRLTETVAATLGRNVKDGRQRLRLREAELAVRVGVHQSWISRIELGHGRAVPLDLWIAIGVALGRPLAVSLSRPLGEPREPRDAGHLAIQEHLLGLSRATGRMASFELPTRSSDPSRSVDVCVRDPRHRILIIEEAWNTFGDIGEAVRATHRKAAEAADLAATIDGGVPYRVATVWVVRVSAANRALTSRYPEILANAFAGPSRSWVVAMTSSVAPPHEAGLVWFDPGTRRLHEWRRPRH